MIHLFDGLVFLFHDVFHNRRIHIAAARAHHHALQRRKSHGGIHAFAVQNGAQAAAVAKVAGNHLPFFRAAQFRRALGNIQMACPVEAIAAHLVLFIRFIRQPIHIGLGRHGLVETRIKHCHLRHRHCLLARFNAADVGRHVQRPQVYDRFQIANHLVVYQHRVGKFFPAVQHTMPHRVNLFQRFYHAVFRVC